ncbi:hypothetical protein BKA56DRAFT_613763 [Ilyonectria sp. MPI-CAGE-AT-0026]|nr:hypothetical protein BKA56DRAFT_613763 [Ilyonectria sp. MPI-CAGE-AT-0026]
MKFLDSLVLPIVATGAVFAASIPSMPSLVKRVTGTLKFLTALDGTTQVPYLEYLPADYSTSSSSTKYPLLIFLHGGSGTGPASGSNIDAVRTYTVPALIESGNTMCFSPSAGQPTQCFITICPQASSTWSSNNVGATIDYAIANYKVNPAQVYLTGLSMGGSGAWTASTSTNNGVYYGSKLAALSTVAGGFTTGTAANTALCQGIVSTKLAVWDFHNSGDPVVPIASDQQTIDRLNNVAASSLGYSCSYGAINPKANLTIYNSNTHGGWDTAYSVTNDIGTGQNLFQWFLAKTNV